MPEIYRLLGGTYPISMGTALVLENKDFDIKKWPNMLYINLRTLYRNYVHSIPIEFRAKVKRNRILQEYLEEVSEVERLVKELSNNRVKVFFYYPTYKSLGHLLPKTDKRKYNPDMFDDIELNMWKYIKETKMMTPFNYTEIEQELPKCHEPTMVLTSFVVDLLSAYNFPVLYLLESFTGKIKRRQEWYTKINASTKKEPNIIVPFNKFTIQIFGDKSGALTGAELKLRTAVREMALKDHWSPVTSMDKIKHSISKLKDTNLKDLIYKYL